MHVARGPKVASKSEDLVAAAVALCGINLKSHTNFDDNKFRNDPHSTTATNEFAYSPGKRRIRARPPAPLEPSPDVGRREHGEGDGLQGGGQRGL